MVSFGGHTRRTRWKRRLGGGTPGWDGGPEEEATRTSVLALMRHVAFSMQFRGHSTALSPGVVTARATAPSSALVTEIDQAGVHGRHEPRPGHEAHLECRLTFHTDTSFDEVGTISFGNGNTLRFHSTRPGTLGPTPDPALQHGTITWVVDNGAGAFAGARGRITSNFLLSSSGDLTDHHLGLLFLNPTHPPTRRNP